MRFIRRPFQILFSLVALLALSSCVLPETIPADTISTGNGDGYSGIKEPVSISDWAQYFRSPIFHADYKMGELKIPNVIELNYQIYRTKVLGDFEVSNVNFQPGIIGIYFTEIGGEKRYGGGEYIYPADFTLNYNFNLSSLMRPYRNYSYEICVNKFEEERVGEVVNYDPDLGNNCRSIDFSIVPPALPLTSDLELTTAQLMSEIKPRGATQIQVPLILTSTNLSTLGDPISLSYKITTLEWNEDSQTYVSKVTTYSKIFALDPTQSQTAEVTSPFLTPGKRGLRICTDSGQEVGLHNDPNLANNCKELYFDVPAP